MSTDHPGRGARRRTRRGRVFGATFAAAVGVLAVVGAAAAAVSVAQGPRVTGMQVDPEAAVAASGARLIVATSQSLAEVSAAQVTIEPDVPFTVDTSGRSVGVRFGMPLRDDTEYTVTIDGVTGYGGGPATTIAETFRTPPVELRLLQRGDGEDTVFRTDLSGQNAVPVFTHPHIEDFRATAAHLVISVLDDDGLSRLIVTDLDGGDARELPLPGDGYVSTLQAADRGELVGYTFSDAGLGAGGGQESLLYTASVAPSAARMAPVPVRVAGADPRVAEWRFVPGTDSIVLLGFDDTLLLTTASGESATSLGTALRIDGVAGTDAYIDRYTGPVVIDLLTGAEQPLVDPGGELGITASVTPVPGGGTLRSFVRLDESGIPTAGATIALVASDGAARPLMEVAPEDAYLHGCVSPSGRYAAVLIAPNAVENPYDGYLLPVPGTLQTRVLELEDGDEVVALAGFGISWCRVPPA